MPEKIKIFIASSAEVNDEREKAILSLTELNKVYPCLHLEPILWEIDMVKGNYPGYNSIQDAINPKLKESNFIVFIFYSRIGKNTMIEFDLAQAQGKKIFVFFKDGFTPQKEHIKSYSKLLDFKEGLEDILKVNYSSAGDFYNLLYRNLNLYLASNHPCNDSTGENELVLTLSRSNQNLIQLLAEKEQEIRRLQEIVSQQPNIAVAFQLEKLVAEKDAITQQLLQSEEIIKQQAKDKESIEQQLSLQKDKDELKAKALIAVEEKDYAKAEEYLKESARNSIEETATTFYELGKIKKLQFQYADALDYLELAIKIDSENSIYLNEAGAISKSYGFYDKAITYFKKALAIEKKFHDEEYPTVATMYNNLGSAYHSKGEYDQAIEHFEKALEIDKRLYGEEHPTIAIRYNNLGAIYNSKEKYDQAIEYFEKALEIGKKLYNEKHPSIAIRFNNLGLAYSNLGEHDKAIDYYLKALTIDKKFYREEHPNIAIRFNNLGLAYRRKGENDKAIEHYVKALGILKKIYGEDHPDIANKYNNLGAAYSSKKEYYSAIEYFEKALVILQKFFSNEHPKMRIIIDNLDFARKALDAQNKNSR